MRHTPSLHHYVVALGGNQRSVKLGSPAHVVVAALAALDAPPLRVIKQSGLISTTPVGPSRRRFVNAAALIETTLEPEALLATLQRLEAQFGRQRRGQRWSARPLDLDIVLWSGGIWSQPNLSIPHPHFRVRQFVLTPLNQIAAEWRDPLSGLRVRHLHARLDRRAIRP